MCERRTHDYVRNGVTSRFAAFHMAEGIVISALHRGHRVAEFRRFLARIRASIPDEFDVHLICDDCGNHQIPAIDVWLHKRPCFYIHFAPRSSSWISQVRRWFGFLTVQLIGRAATRLCMALEADLRFWVATGTKTPRSFVWTKTAEEIVEALVRFQPTSGAGN